MNTKYKFIQEWNEDTNISWRKKNRTELNKIIRLFNNWQIENDFDPKKVKYILAKIEYGIQTIGSIDGGEKYMKDLKEMKRFVLSISNTHA